MQPSLKDKLMQLKQALSDLDELDDESRQLLTQLDTDIQAALKGDVDDTLSTRLEHQAVEFDTQHPSTAAVLRDIIDALGKMGI